MITQYFINTTNDFFLIFFLSTRFFSFFIIKDKHYTPSRGLNRLVYQSRTKHYRLLSEVWTKKYKKKVQSYTPTHSSTNKQNVVRQELKFLNKCRLPKI